MRVLLGAGDSVRLDICSDAMCAARALDVARDREMSLEAVPR
jgi:hypothetical protein